MLSHKKYLPDIKLEIINRKDITNIIYKDEYQVVEELKWN